LQLRFGRIIYTPDFASEIRAVQILLTFHV
jgi:hypothetical protein